MKITIIGAGIAGMTAAIAFKNAGFETLIFEAAKEIRPVGAGLGLAPNAVKSLQKLGLAEKVIPLGRKLPYFRILEKDGRVITENNSHALSEKFGLDNFTIHRHLLHKVLMNELDQKTVVTGKKAVDLKINGDTTRVFFEDGSFYETDYLIIADGMNSVLRKYVFPQSTVRYAGYTCWRSVAHLPDYPLEGASETWDVTGRFGIVPLANEQVYWFACIKSKADNASYTSFSVKDLQKHFRDFHAPVRQILEASESSPLIHTDIYDLQPMAHYTAGNILILGDAAHGATPNMGQGACQAIEDAAALYVLLTKSLPLNEMFLAFEKLRREKTHYIIKQSRSVGAMAQLSNPVLAKLRNFALRVAPVALQQKQFEKLYNINF